MDRLYGPDELRRSWCLITMKIDRTGQNSHIHSCEIADGNQHQLFETKTLTAETLQEESDLLQNLAEELDNRRYDDMVLVTSTEEALATLRTQLLTCEAIPTPTLRGFRHVAVIDLLTAYFDDNWIQHFSELPGISYRDDTEQHCSTEVQCSSVDTLWELRTAIGSLIPPKDLQGEPL